MVGKHRKTTTNRKYGINMSVNLKSNRKFYPTLSAKPNQKQTNVIYEIISEKKNTKIKIP